MKGTTGGRRHGLASDGGFSLVELLVVVIIVGILAAIAIPVYLGIQNNSKNASVLTDVANAKLAVVAVQNSSGAVPGPAADVSTVVTRKDGYTKGENTGTIKLSVGTGSPYLFCISSTVVNGDNSKFFSTDTAGVSKVATGNPLPSGC